MANDLGATGLVKWSFWIVVSMAVVGMVAIFAGPQFFEPDLPAENAPEPRPTTRFSDEAWPDRAFPRDATTDGLEGESGPPASTDGDEGQVAAGDAIAPDSSVESAIDAEIRWAEDALTASRRMSASAGPAPAAAPSFRASPEALAAAALGSSAEALGCGAQGAVCQSSADCCSALACAGGIAGFGTVGHCESAPRAP